MSTRKKGWSDRSVPVWTHPGHYVHYWAFSFNELVCERSFLQSDLNIRLERLLLKYWRLVDQWLGLSLLQSQLCGYENRLLEIKGRCGKAEGWRWWEMRWRRISLKFYSHLAPSTPNKFSVHTAPCIAIETFLLITTETSFPTPDKESSLPVETARISHFQGPPPCAGCTYQHTPPPPPSLHISTFSTFPPPLARHFSLFSRATSASHLLISCHLSPFSYSSRDTAGEWHCWI